MHGNANDIAIGVERCWGGTIDDTESYLNYVELLAFICEKFNLDPTKDIISHGKLDPKRRYDPMSSFEKDNYKESTTMERLIEDVEDWLMEDITIVKGDLVMKGFMKKGISYAPVRELAGSLDAEIVWNANSRTGA